MKIWNGIDSYPHLGEVVASIGNYDGVHLGHQAILREVVERATRRSIPSLLITFRPHPMAVLAPERGLQLLQTDEQQYAALERTGLDNLLLIDFTPEVALLEGEQFFSEYLGSRVNFAAILVGEEFRFGRGRSGDKEMLRRIGEDRAFEVFGVPSVRIAGQVVSSSAIRGYVKDGNVEHAQRMLGRPFELSGAVIRGEDRGGKLSFPTANLEPQNEITPGTGVYVTETATASKRFHSLTNIGFRPTFGGKSLSIESHLLDFAGDLYGERITVSFLTRLRDEMRFASAAELVAQIGRDRSAAESYFDQLDSRTNRQ